MKCSFCWGKWCDCGYVEEVDRAHMAQRAADMDEAVTGVYVRTVTERMEAEDEEQRQDMARYGEDDR